MKLSSDHRLLTAYASVLTAAFVVLLFTGFGDSNRDPRFKEITVERINVVEPDGTLRLVISNKERTPGIYIRGEERLPGLRNTAGLIFLNDEGTECGGLSFHGSKGEDGVERALGHLSFDGYMQDQLLTLDAGQTGERRSATININDQPFWEITEFIELLERIADLPPEEQEAAIEEFKATHPQGQNRMTVGRGGDRSVGVVMRDAEGRPRIVMLVLPDGTPTLQFWNEAGEVIHQLPN